MENKLTLKIENFGLINEAHIELNKINVVGGINSSGKSTASKLLYCFLKANSSKKIELIVSRFGSFYWSKNGDLIQDYSDEFNKLYDKYNEKFDKSLLTIWDVKNFIRFLSIDDGQLSSYISRYLLHNESLDYFIDKSYFLSGEEYDHNGSVMLFGDDFRSVIHGKPDIFDCSDEYFSYSTKGNLDNIDDVFYISPISILDLNKYMNNSKINSKILYGTEEHIYDLLNNLDESSLDTISDELQQKIDNVDEKIFRIINGTFNSKKNFQNVFYSPNITNTSSGIKQIGLIQLLLHNKKLKPGVFLIIDEPEVNLHPEWQFKFAQILVLIAKELDVTIYINSHSPMFIEAVEVSTSYEDMEDDVNYYLTELSDNSNVVKIEEEVDLSDFDTFDITPNQSTFEINIEGFSQEFTITKWDAENHIATYNVNENLKTYNFTKVELENLEELYNNLSNPYDLIEVYRLKAEYKKNSMVEL